MKLDMEIGKKIRDAVVPKGEEFDLRTVIKILTDYISDMIHVSEDKFTNPAFFWTIEDYTKIIQERQFFRQCAQNLLDEINYQTSNSLIALTRWILYRKKEFERREEERDQKHSDEKKKLKAEIEKLKTSSEGSAECKK